MCLILLCIYGFIQEASSPEIPQPQPFQPTSSPEQLLSTFPKCQVIVSILFQSTLIYHVVNIYHAILYIFNICLLIYLPDLKVKKSKSGPCVITYATTS